LSNTARVWTFKEIAEIIDAATPKPGAWTLPDISMTWRKFWMTFLTVQVAGFAFSFLGIFISLYVVYVGMLLLFPGVLIASNLSLPTDRASSGVVAVITMLIVNVLFWIMFLRPKPKPNSH
jgi:hypothetical protein